MQPIIYDVAVSLDGFISGPSEDTSKFAYDGAVVDEYLMRLGSYATAIMGRATYEFGYRFGLSPGQNPYPGMRTFVYSATLECPEARDITVVPQTHDSDLRALKQSSSGPIYLCGGGAFAGALLRRGLIDIVRFKRAPIVLGDGVRVFGETTDTPPLRRRATKTYDNGYLLEEFVL